MTQSSETSSQIGIPVYRGDREKIDESGIPWALKVKLGVHLDAYSDQKDAFEEVTRALMKEQNAA